MPEKTVSRLRTKDLTLVALFTALMAVCAWISIPAVSYTHLTLPTIGSV